MVVISRVLRTELNCLVEVGQSAVVVTFRSVRACESIVVICVVRALLNRFIVIIDSALVVAVQKLAGSAVIERDRSRVDLERLGDTRQYRLIVVLQLLVECILNRL